MRRVVAAAMAAAAMACTGTLEGPSGSGVPTPGLPPLGVLADGGVIGKPPHETPPAHVQDPPDAGPPVYPPAGVRRLTRAELEIAATQLLGAPATTLGAAVGDDLRQSGFTRNADQRLDAEQAEALRLAAEALAQTVVTQRLAALAPCTTTGGSEGCARTFIERFAAQAFRRGLRAGETDALLTVYRAGAQDRTYAQGIELVITAVLQSGSFLYVTELGTDTAPDQLSGEELATSLAFLFTGGPADDALLTRGRMGQLATGEQRAAAARELLATPAGRKQAQRLVLEWLTSDTVDTTPRDETLFPGWAAVRADVLAESKAIIDAVLDGDGKLSTLLSTPQTNVSAGLAGWYSLAAPGPQLQPPWRRGLLLAGAFTASQANPDGTAPVRRGAMVRRTLLCQDLPLPSGEGVNLVVPPADPSRTTRERFAAHTQNASCAGCHSMLDPIGFALETFDAVGRYRTTENGLPIDPSGALVNAGDADGAFTDAVGLVSLLAPSRAVAECFERHLVRFALGREAAAEERAFVDFVRARPSGQDGRVLELLVDWAASDSFARRQP